MILAGITGILKVGRRIGECVTTNIAVGMYYEASITGKIGVK